METVLLAAATGSGLLWCALLVFRGGFWRADQVLTECACEPKVWPEVVAIIPARNEAGTIGTVADAHGQSDYPGTYSLVIVDDHSDDGTAARAAAAQARSKRSISLIQAPDLEPGWSGKLWALQAGLASIASSAPAAKYVLLTDADILHAPDTARRLVAKAESESLALVSLMALLDCRGLWGTLLVPPFVFFFQKLYPFPWINAVGSRQAGAAGGCVLVRRDALAEIGGIAAIRTALIDDCALAAAIKGDPPWRAIWLGLTRSVKSLRDNRSLESIWTMVARTAFTQLRHSAVLLGLSVIGMALTYLAGPAALIGGLAFADGGLALAGATAWGLAAFAYWPTAKLYGRQPLWTLTLPVAAAFYSAMTLASAVNHWRGKGGRWKGRNYTQLAGKG